MNHRCPLPVRPFLAALVAPLALGSCATSTAWHIPDGLEANSVELQIDDDGRTREIEYILPAEAVPEAVQIAMEKLHPGGTTLGAEKEYIRGEVYWELTKEIDGFEVEAMFLASGELYGSEAQVPASAVSQRVRNAVERSGWGEVSSWEQVNDGDGELTEYHVKTTREGLRYKLVLSLEGELLAVWRELEAEIEIPVAIE